jgi:hypothetical protein
MPGREQCASLSPSQGENERDVSFFARPRDIFPLLSRLAAHILPAYEVSAISGQPPVFRNQKAATELFRALYLIPRSETGFEYRKKREIRNDSISVRPSAMRVRGEGKRGAPAGRHPSASSGQARSAPTRVVYHLKSVEMGVKTVVLMQFEAVLRLFFRACHSWFFPQKIIWAGKRNKSRAVCGRGETLVLR